MAIQPDLEIEVLMLWAKAMDIASAFSDDQIEAVPSLRQVIGAARFLPDGIGWGDDFDGHADGAPSLAAEEQPPRSTRKP